MLALGAAESGATTFCSRSKLTGLIIPIMRPVGLTPEKQCYSVLLLQIFRKVDINER
jgi:hypothetical protein